ncbi:unnamed protein product [Cyprideis torosa]|uniref:ferredoxin--NADP(+) reductase n=1 Tax=Cyprideis torosa TaxID=163714 RepID=A0A7R8WUJ3_9CRUS|nr:unnamed protein product [Cyprideis torosa]CAG0910670.1 unnamed protein product [Cyprideis torosa]
MSLRIAAPTQSFLAGQFVRLQMTLDGNEVVRTYSLVNSPDNPVTEILFNTVPNGAFSNALAKLVPGDPIGVSQPASGFFTLNEVPGCDTLWLFATGTGTGPFLSMLQTDEPWNRFAQTVLVQSVPRVEDLAYANIFRDIANRRGGQFRYLPCVTQASFEEGINQRFTTALSSGLLESVAGQSITAKDSHVMLCGNHRMLDDMKSLLGERGLHKHLRHKPGHITTEQYF